MIAYCYLVTNLGLNYHVLTRYWKNILRANNISLEALLG